MIRTLKRYLARDLAKATLLATVALTVVMTVFAVIEPLREQGLSAGQALKLFGYILPLMFSLTLPIGALFAATIVYGRFSQDNELMASRASGICTLSLLGPAVWLGVIVTFLTLLLAFYIAPSLLALSEKTARNDIEQIAYHRLKTKGYVKYGDLILHATEVRPERGWVFGAVGLKVGNRRDAMCSAAASAKLEFRQVGGQTIAVVYPTNPWVFRQSGGTVGRAERQGIRVGELPSIGDRPRTYDLRRLWRTLARPEESALVAYGVEKIKRNACLRKFYVDVVRTIQGRREYEMRELAPAEPEMPLQRVEIRTDRARVHQGKEVYLGPAGAGAAAAASSSQPAAKTVVVREYSGPRLKRELVARAGRIKGVWDRLYGAPMAAVTLWDVEIRFPGETRESPRVSQQEEMGPYAVAREIVDPVQAMDLKAIEADPEMGSWREIVADIKSLRTRAVRKLLAKVEAEIHQRAAYGLSCLFMVMLGAALGLMLRGGQVLAAFAISAVPAAVVILVLLMGRELIANPGVKPAYGIACIWGGVGALALATLYIYAVPMRR